jgi:hypothetical protein
MRHITESQNVKDAKDLDEMRAKLADLYQKAEEAWCRFIEQEERKRLN